MRKLVPSEKENQNIKGLVQVIVTCVSAPDAKSRIAKAITLLLAAAEEGQELSESNKAPRKQK